MTRQGSSLFPFLLILRSLFLFFLLFSFGRILGCSRGISPTFVGVMPLLVMTRRTRSPNSYSILQRPLEREKFGRKNTFGPCVRLCGTLTNVFGSSTRFVFVCLWFLLLCVSHQIFSAARISKVIRSLRCDRRPQDTCQGVPLHCLVSFDWRPFGENMPGRLQSEAENGFSLSDSRRRLTRRIHNLSPNFNCYVSVYITLFCLLDGQQAR